MRKLPSLHNPTNDPPTPEPETDGPEQANETPEPQRFQISIKMMLMLTLIFAVASAAYGGLRRGGGDRTFYIMFAMMAPLAVLFVVGLVHQWTRRRQRRRKRGDW